MGKLLGLVARAQSYHLRGVGDATHAAYGLGGTVSPSYDFSAPGAVSEVKKALSALAQKETVAAQPLLDDDVWDDAAAIEFALFVGRHRSKMPWALTDPFVVDAPYPSKPQPTVWGLELLAGAVNTELDQTFKMSTYEAWRGGVYAPPSVISRPPQSAGLRPTYNFAPHTFLPSGTSSDLAAGVGMFDTMLKALIGRALVLTNEADRTNLKNVFLTTSQEREAAVAATVASSDFAAQAAADCAAAGGTWFSDTQLCAMQRAPIAPPAVTDPGGATDPSTMGAIILLGLGAGALYFVFKR